MAEPTPSRLTQVQILPGKAPCESLVQALCAVICCNRPAMRADGTCDNNTVHALLSIATGTSLMLGYAPSAPAGCRWNKYGRHAFLLESARLLGVRLRPLHPASAAPIPDPPLEFDQHFRDSYFSFVEEAIERDTPVLAWMGWPAPESSEWGVITAVHHETRACTGSVGASGRGIRMVRAPVQLYTVEEYERGKTTDCVPVDHILRVAATILDNRLEAEFRVETGAAAIQRWRDRRAGDDVPDDVDLIERLVGGRQLVADHMASRLNSLEGEQREAAQRFRKNADGLDQALTPLKSNLGRGPSEQSRRELDCALDEALRLEASLADFLNKIVPPDD